MACVSSHFSIVGELPIETQLTYVKRNRRNFVKPALSRFIKTQKGKKFGLPVYHQMIFEAHYRWFFQIDESIIKQSCFNKRTSIKSHFQKRKNKNSGGKYSRTVHSVRNLNGNWGVHTYGFAVQRCWVF